MGADPYRTNDRRVIPWLLLGLLVLFGGLYVALHHYTADRIPRGTSVNGIEVGGLRPAAAERKLAEGLGGRAAEPLVVTALGRRGVIRPATAGLSVDVRRTVDGARSDGSWHPRSLWDYVTDGTARDAAVSIDSAALDAAVAAFAERVDRPAVDGAVTFRAGTATARYPRRGTVVDREAAAEAVRAAFLRDNGPQDVLALPTVEDRERIDADAVSRVMERFANPAMSEPVTVRLGRRAVTLSPEDYGPALSVQAVGSALRPRVDRDRLLGLVEPRLSPGLRRPQDADVRIVAGRPRVVGGRAGTRIDAGQVVTAFVGAVSRTGAGRTAVVRPRAVPPEVGAAEVRALGITEQVSQFATRVDQASGRSEELARAAARLDHTLLEPGQTFSLVDTLGGGGDGQVATTLLNAALLAGLDDVEHQPHASYVPGYPAGRDAALVRPGDDLRFANSTPHGVLVTATVDAATPARRGTLRVAMWSTRQWDVSVKTSERRGVTSAGVRRLTGPGCRPQAGSPGFDVDVLRVWRRPGSGDVLRRERTHTSYLPADRVVCDRSAS